MALFTNFATLSYNGRTTNSNTVTGEILETLTAEKTAAAEAYAPGGDVVYVISLINSGPAPLTGLTVTDDLGGYMLGGSALYPLSYKEGSIRYYMNGALQPAPAVTAGPPMVIDGVDVPALGNAMLIYEADVTPFAPLDAAGEIVNTAVVTGPGLVTPVSASETLPAAGGAELSILKALTPAVVTADGQITYRFTLENSGNAPAAAEENAVLTDRFDPILRNIAVDLDGTAWTEGVNYTYDESTGAFATLPGQLAVPAACFARNGDGSWTVSPGAVTLTVTGDM